MIRLKFSTKILVTGLFIIFCFTVNKQIIQQNATNSEETAASAEELSAQAENFKEIVSQIVQLIQGRKLK